MAIVQQVAAWTEELSARAAEEALERRALRRAVLWAVALHAVLLAVTLPQWRATPRVPAAGRSVHVLRQVRFQAPPPAAAQPQPRKTTARRVPIPDPTPDDPEPLPREQDLDIDLEVALPDLAGILPIPEAPGPRTFGGQVPLRVGGEVRAPVKIYGPLPPYSEAARLARVQGVVLLETVIDPSGSVVDIQVLKGLSSGLTESAVQTVSQWKFRPATQAGEPVAVYYVVTISFSVV